MSKYVERNLNNGEEVILQAKKSIWVLIPAILFRIIMISQPPSMFCSLSDVHP